MLTVQALLDEFMEWAKGESAVLAVALVGSYARGTARAASDVDLVVLLEDPHSYLQHGDWIGRFGAVASVEHEDWGLVQSLRVFYAGGPEVEFGLTSAQWAATTPVDPGTRAVVSDGMRILSDPAGVLAALAAAVARA